MIQFNRASLGNRVLLKPQIEKVSKGGIVLARGEREQAINTDRGEVFMVGPECWYDMPNPPEISVGDKVLYSHYGAKTIKDGEEFFVICNDVDILVGYTEEAQND